MKLITLSPLLLLVFSLNLFAKDNSTIDVGLITMLSGPGKVYGQVAANSAKLAVSRINKKGINGKKLKLHIRDTNTAPATALSVTKELIQQDVDLIVGFHTSDERFAVKNYIEAQQKLYLYL
jgi:ABC-type branched-subunit amino acid transport system substrate-binding protein